MGSFGRRAALVLALLAAALLRTTPLLDNRFHPDEALYASFGLRIAAGHDPLLAGVLVDKPPLPFYLLALSLGLIGGTELAARLPALLASLVSVALIYALAARLYGARTGLLAAWLLALSPFAILFSITVFLDPLLTALLLWAWVVAAPRGRPAAPSPPLAVLAVASALALAFAVKQTAVLFVPLALGLWLLRLPADATPRAAARHLARLAIPVAAGLALAGAAAWLWDLSRQAPIGFWTQGFADNLPRRLIRAVEVLPRARAWLALLHYISASTWVNVLGLAVIAALLIVPRHPSPAALADRLLAGFILLYLAAYWLLAFNVWDRYLLPIVPLVLILAARGLIWVMDSLQRPPIRHAAAGLALVLAVALAPPALGAARSAYPIGGDHGAYDGIDQAAAYLRTQPEGSVLYDFWLSWQWAYYLYDGPVYVAWLPAPSALTTDLRAFGAASPRYIAIPAWEADTEVRAAAAAAGYALEVRHTAYRRDGVPTLTVYALRPASDG
jgi:4-amino-4-deoxy-L-arabinose transferase-like glycosyltransferase